MNSCATVGIHSSTGHDQPKHVWMKTMLAGSRLCPVVCSLSRPWSWTTARAMVEWT